MPLGSRLFNMMSPKTAECRDFVLTSGMRHPKYFFRSNRGLMARCSSVRKRVWVSFCWLYGNLIVTVGIVLAISQFFVHLVCNEAYTDMCLYPS